MYVKVRVRYKEFLEAVGAVQEASRKGVIEASEWPHAEAVAPRMGITQEDVRQIVAEWDRFVDTALAEFAE